MAVGIAITGCTAVLSDSRADQLHNQELAAHLTASGASMYGAYWCPHCADQKELFGDAAAAIPYVECDPEGENAQPQLCPTKKLVGYPTWEINGEFYPGVRSLNELAKLSNFPGQ